MSEREREPAIRWMLRLCLELLVGGHMMLTRRSGEERSVFRDFIDCIDFGLCWLLNFFRLTFWCVFRRSLEIEEPRPFLP